MIAMLIILAAQSSVVGDYRASQMEVGAVLRLQAGGHFQYRLDYGAVSEVAEGDWNFDGKTVRLATRPKPVPPHFEVVSDSPAPPGEIDVAIEPPGFGADGYRLELIATDAVTGERGLVTADADGRIVTERKLSAVEPLVPVYGISGGKITLDPRKGHRLLLRFHANDLGHASFDNEPLLLTADGLVLNRFGTQIRFIRRRP